MDESIIYILHPFNEQFHHIISSFWSKTHLGQLTLNFRWHSYLRSAQISNERAKKKDCAHAHELCTAQITCDCRLYAQYNSFIRDGGRAVAQNAINKLIIEDYTQFGRYL